MAKVEFLSLNGNQISNEGMASFSTALASGAMAKLKALFISNPSGELKTLCSSKSIKLNTV
eukprot:2021476-Prymnesium_polylepis.1